MRFVNTTIRPVLKRLYGSNPAREEILTGIDSGGGA